MRAILWVAGWLGCFVILYGGYIVGTMTHPLLGAATYVVALTLAGTTVWLIEKYRPGWIPEDSGDGISADEEEMYQELKAARKRLKAARKRK